MKLRMVVCAALTALFISAVGYAADGDKPAKADAKVDVKGVRLIKPYTDLKDLTAEQTTNDPSGSHQ